MAVTWTDEQREAIDLYGKDILVSAAAGSGKTAVLVERILGMITREDHPVDVDHLLIVTFTRAAAGEMKERLRNALEKRLEENPSDHHLQQQMTFLHNAQISTIDGFCSYVIRNYYHLIDLDPAYRTADEGELKLLKGDVVKEVLEEAYEEGSEDFLTFVECYARGKSDSGLEDMILDLYEASQSHPWPEEWLDFCRKSYHASSQAETLETTEWFFELMTMVNEILEDCRNLTQESIDQALSADGPYMYEEALRDDLEMITRLWNRKNYEDGYHILAEHSWAKLSGKRDKSVSTEIKDLIKERREQVKKMMGNVKEYFSLPLKSVCETMKSSSQQVDCLVTLTEKFSQKFTEKKRSKNLLDFSDMEHLALKILIDRKEGISTRTKAAIELSQRFEEILIDEYQDSNYVQEMLLQSISRNEEGGHNIFMVGDVKQSIYRFRLANPDLFMRKYYSYSKESGDERRIDLHKNFRSRREVVDFVNWIFQRTMRPEFGGVIYDEDARLVLGAEYYPEASDMEPEILLIDKGDEVIKEEGVPDFDRELEARLIGKRILELTKTESVMMGQTMRKARYSDCVILLRSLSGYGEIMLRVLQSMGIPACVTSRTGYFSAPEVVTLLNVLKICDNPRQDLPLTAVLRSPVLGLSAEELAEIRKSFGQGDMYESCRAYGESGRDEELKSKLKQFLEFLSKIQKMSSYTPIHQLITMILEETGYGNLVRAMPAGDQRSANLMMLVEKAKEYESGSFHGLFNFIRYIEKLNTYEIDFGEANISSEQDDTVRIMTIHKSKGLEFPIVFLAGLGKMFNQRELNDSVLVHPDLGVAPECVDPDRRICSSTLFRQMMRRKLKIENLSEELRVLYVALTRAKEKLILTGCGDRMEKRLEAAENFTSYGEEQLPSYIMTDGRDYLSWILPALAGSPYKTRVVSAQELLVDETRRQLGQESNKYFLQNLNRDEIYDKELREIIEGRFSYSYPMKGQTGIPVKVTVSELKKESLSESQEYPGEELYPEEEVHFEKEEYPEADMIPIIPEFIKKKEEAALAAERGTAYHRVMEKWDYSRVDASFAQVKDILDEMRDRELLSDRQRQCVYPDDFLKFLASSIGQRMQAAAQRGDLIREQPFTMAIDASRRDPGLSDEDEILVQGIIDAFFFEEDGIVLVDYKTDRVRDGGQLMERYQKQLDYYAEAITRTTGKPVKEKLIYSFALGCEISCG